MLHYVKITYTYNKYVKCYCDKNTLVLQCSRFLRVTFFFKHTFALIFKIKIKRSFKDRGHPDFQDSRTLKRHEKYFKQKLRKIFKYNKILYICDIKIGRDM